MTAINILNLKCNGCANTIKKGLGSIEGIKELEVNLENSYVKIDSVDESVIKNVKVKLASMGYPEFGDANTLMRKSKSFESCVPGRMNNSEEVM